MSAILENLKAQALQLSAPDRNELIRTLIESIDGEPEGTPEEIAQAWEEEIARRIADHEAGRTKGIPADEVFARTRALLDRLGKR
jgi:putative addiction module component (TIGR02574 family)